MLEQIRNCGNGRQGIPLAGLLAGLLLAAAVAADDPAGGVRAKPFSDPDKLLTQLPADWDGKKIKHAPEDKGADLAVALDQQLYPAFSPIIQDYAKQHGLRIVIHNGTCGLSQGKLLRKEVEIGGYCCPPGETDRLPGLRFHTIGIAPIAIIVHADNPLNNITTEQARDIFKGEHYRWSELTEVNNSAVSGLTIQPVARLHCKVRPGHWRLLLANEDLFSPRLYEVGAIPDMISQVATNSSAIGYETLWMVHDNQNKSRVKALNIDGFPPGDLARLAAGKYPVYRTYSITTWEGKGISSPAADELAQYLIEQAEHLDPKYGLIPPSRLKRAGWKFRGDELIGEPG